MDFHECLDEKKNFLLLNSYKTETLMLGTKSACSKVTNFATELNGYSVETKDTVKKIVVTGKILVYHFDFFINNISKTSLCFYKPID